MTWDLRTYPHFSNFFKKHARKSPVEYRNSAVLRIKGDFYNKKGKSAHSQGSFSVASLYC